MSADELHDLITALESAGCTVRGKSVTCAFHGDRNASGSIYNGTDGRPRYRCHGCDVRGDAADIIAAATGRPLAEVLRSQDGRQGRFPPERQRIATSWSPDNSGKQEMAPMDQNAKAFPDLAALLASLGRTEAVYRYDNPATGAVDLAVIRMQGKRFLQASPCPAGGWWMKRPAGPLPLYRRSGFQRHGDIVVVEGEKDADALAGIGLLATTAPMGADAVTTAVDADGKPGLVDWSPLAGRSVILWGDNDEPGRRHMDRIQRVLMRLSPAPTIHRVDLSRMDGAKDAADLIDRAKDDREAALAIVGDVLNHMHEVSASSPLLARLDAAMAGQLVHTPLPWPALDRLARPLMPGSITVLAGDPGASKSFMLMQAALGWLADGLPVALLELEESAAFWQQRALALLAGNGLLTDLEHVRTNPEATRSAYLRHRRDLDRFAAALTCAPTGGMTLAAVSAWIGQRVAAGAKLLIVDPISATDEGREPWNEARVFMSAAQAAIAGKAALMISTHGKKRTGPKQPPGLDDISGAAAYGRFCSNALWLEAHPEPEPSSIVDADGHQTMATCNRSIRILKSRNGKGTGLRVGFHFDGVTLRLEESGAMIAKPSAGPSPQPSRARTLMGPPGAGEDRFNHHNPRE